MDANINEDGYFFVLVLLFLLLALIIMLGNCTNLLESEKLEAAGLCPRRLQKVKHFVILNLIGVAFQVYTLVLKFVYRIFSLLSIECMFPQLSSTPGGVIYVFTFLCQPHPNTASC